ncbi:protein canopy 4 [Thrips palmi]|uniref:Protein canopy 4 n=1 Tax=Thrips palmi TaxID=161013 RepID=A0A6P8Z6T9_THRPL|nr:protein canopy 4 [Thrips palmi]
MRTYHLIVILLAIPYICLAGKEEDEGVKFANKCEVCKILAIELENRLEETGKSKDVIEIGYSLDDAGSKKKKTKYKKSELRLVESLEGICERVLEYNIHKERTDSTRFAKGMSQTFRTLHGLVNKGVKVELGIPQELWDKPSVEITNMKTQCEMLLEEHESDIEEWYFKSEGNVPLKSYLCSQLVLQNGDDSCLLESDNDGLANSKTKSESQESQNNVKDKEEL